MEQKPDIKDGIIDDFIRIYYRLLLPSVLLAIVITGHKWGLPTEARELAIAIFGLCVKTTFGKKD